MGYIGTDKEGEEGGEAKCHEQSKAMCRGEGKISKTTAAAIAGYLV